MKASQPKIIELYPATGKEVDLKGLYLLEELANPAARDKPLVYANFLSSLDGRIAVRSPGEEHHDLPEVLKTTNDFCLFLELFASADCIITHSAYMRALQAGRLGNVLRLPEHESMDYLRAWRSRHGLQAEPDVIILSSSLDFPLQKSWFAEIQNIQLVTGKRHDPSQLGRWTDAGFPVHVTACNQMIDAAAIMQFLVAQQYRSAYLVAGPLLLQSMLKHGRIDRFFLTMRHHVLGGGDFHTLIPETLLDESGGMCLRRLYLDQSEGLRRAQWFSEFSMLRE